MSYLPKTNPRPTHEEVQQLNGFLAQKNGGPIPNVEALDGFFAALICCPELVMPSEYLSILKQGDTEDDCMEFENLEHAEVFMALVMQHWNFVIHQLSKAPRYAPLLLEDNESECGRDWARGFMGGVQLRPSSWSEVIEERGEWMAPITAMASPNHPDPDLQSPPEPLDEAQRQDLITEVAFCVKQMYVYFLSRRRNGRSASMRPGGRASAARRPVRRYPRDR